MAFATFALVAQNRVDLLLAAYLACLMFSGNKSQVLDEASTALRWWIMLVLAVSVLRRRHKRSPGASIGLVFLVSCLALALTPRSARMVEDVPFAVMMIVATGPFALLLAVFLRDTRRMEQLARYVVVVAVIYVVLAITSLGSLRAGTRFQGGTESAPLFALTGGLLVPAITWAAFYDSGARRRLAQCLLPAVVLLALLSGQRTGIIAGAIGLVPFVVLSVLRMRPGLFLRLGTGVAIVAYFVTTASTFAFSLGRLQSFDLKGRDERWAEAVRLILNDPILGHGGGSHRHTGFGFHNALLAIAYDAGVIAAALWCVAFAIAARQGFLVLRRSPDRRLQSLSALALGLLLASFVSGFSEQKLYSPTNFASFSFLAGCIMCYTLARILRSRRSLPTPLIPPGPLLRSGFGLSRN